MKKRRRKSLPRMSINQLIERRRHIRALLMGVFFTLILGGLLYRIWWYQAVWGDEYTQLAAQQSARQQIGLVSRTITPSRGGIVDRNNQPLANTQQAFEVFLDVTALQVRHVRTQNDDADPALVVNAIADAFAAIYEALRIHPSDMHPWFELNSVGELARPTHHRILRRDVPPEIALPLAAAVPEVHATPVSLRWYNDPFFAPQVLGFIRGDTLWGLESRYNRELTGSHGRTIWIQGGEVEEVPVTDGFTLVTTFDSDIQRLAQDMANLTFLEVPSRHVGITVMNPHTGEILAMAQAPTFSLAAPFNPNYFTCPTLVYYWDSMPSYEQAAEVNRLWRNYHTTHSGEPGSTFKPIVIAAAIEEGLITWDDQFTCEGWREINDQVIWCWQTGGHDTLTVRQALAQSCNLVMVDINGLLQRTLFYRYRGYFGFSFHTGIDLPGETDVSSGNVMYTYGRLHRVEMATSSMGQGFNTTTIQMINAYAALINGGNMMQPFFVSHIFDSHGNLIEETVPTIVRRVISQDTSDQMRRNLEAAVIDEDGTARRIAIPGHTIGSKTGTGQQGDRVTGGISLHQVAFTPVENPEFLIMMSIDHVDLEITERRAASAGTLVSPRLRDLMVQIIEVRNLQPVEAGMDMSDWLITLGADTMQDFTGQRMADVSRQISHPGGFHVVGGGTIISHHIPQPGALMADTNPIIFHTDSSTRIEDSMTIVPDVMSVPLDQARMLVLQAGLPYTQIINSDRDSDDEAFPHTTSPVYMNELEFAPPPPPPRVVYRQFPLPGTVVEHGTQVILRAR